MGQIFVEGKPVTFPGSNVVISGHLVLIYKDDSGAEYVIRGGPQHDSHLDRGALVVNNGGFPGQLLSDSPDARALGETPADRGSIEIDLGVGMPKIFGLSYWNMRGLYRIEHWPTVQRL